MYSRQSTIIVFFSLSTGIFSLGIREIGIEVNFSFYLCVCVCDRTAQHSTASYNVHIAYVCDFCVVVVVAALKFHTCHAMNVQVK